MATQNISGKIQFRRDTAANWTSKNPTLLAGELGYETDTHKGKVGDGSTAWKSLPYVWKTTVATGSTNGTIAVDGTDVAVKGLGSAAYTESTAYAPASHSHSYLPLSGGTLTGNLTFSGTAPQIYYNGSKANYSLIRFIDNASDSYGNGISIGGGGAVILGGGEAATTMQDTIIGTGAGKGGTEILALCGDGNVDVYSNCQNGAGSAKKFSFNTGGVFQVPTGGSITVGGTAVSLNGHNHSLITTAGDTRAVATKPDDYGDKITFAGLKNSSAVASPSSDTYSYIVGLRGWRDTSGGQSHELAFNDSGLFHRIGTSGTAWGSWKKLVYSDHTHASNTINAMTGYSKPATTSAITASDTLNTAIGKLEKALEPDVSLSINDPGGSSVWIEVPVEHLIVGSTTPTDHNAIWIEIIS